MGGFRWYQVIWVALYFSKHDHVLHFEDVPQHYEYQKKKYFIRHQKYFQLWNRKFRRTLLFKSQDMRVYRKKNHQRRCKHTVVNLHTLKSKVSCVGYTKYIPYWHKLCRGKVKIFYKKFSTFVRRNFSPAFTPSI